MKITDLMTDESLEENGAWVKITEEFQFKVRASDYEPFVKLMQKLKKPYQDSLRDGQELPTKLNIQLNVKAMAEHALVDWKGLYDENGKEIKYSKEMAVKMLTTAKIFRNYVMAGMMDQENFKLKARSKAAKNSATS